jgi:predicted Zn-dependent protease
MKPRHLYFLFVLVCAPTGCASSPPPRRETPPETSGRAPTTAAALFRRGMALAGAGQLVRAEQYLSLALERGYPEEEALPALLRVCLASSRLRTALNHAESRLVRRPDDWSLRFLAASILLAMGEQGRAREELERVVAYRGGFGPAHYLLAMATRDRFADLTATRRHFTAYLRIEPRGEHAEEAASWLRAHPIEAGNEGSDASSGSAGQGGGR